MTDDIPPLKRPEEMGPIRSQADLHRLWRALMQQLGFGSRQLWLALLDADDRCTPVVQNIVEIPDVPDAAMLEGLAVLCRGLLDQAVPGGSVAFLVARPGPAGIDAADRAWATGILAAMSRAEVSCRPVHLANDHEIHVFTVDDQIASA